MWNAKPKTLLICFPKGNLLGSSSSTCYWVSIIISGVADRQGLLAARQASPNFHNHIKVRSTGLHRTEGKATFLVANLPYCSRSRGLSLTYRYHLNTYKYIYDDRQQRRSKLETAVQSICNPASSQRYIGTICALVLLFWRQNQLIFWPQVITESGH